MDITEAVNHLSTLLESEVSPVTYEAIRLVLEHRSELMDHQDELIARMVAAKMSLSRAIKIETFTKEF